MKGLSEIPSTAQLQQAYATLQSTLRTKVACSEADLALWVQWSRFDPRLAEQITAHIINYWSNLNPMVFNEKNRQQPWPALLGVIIEQARLFSHLPADQTRLFRAWSKVVMTHVDPAPWQQYFMGLRKPGGQLMQDDARYSLACYRQWGYLGREFFMNKAEAALNQTTACHHQHTLLSSTQRKQRLDELLKTQARLTVNEYRRALDFAVGRRQAELDLRNHPRLKPQGQTRSRVYVRLSRRGQNQG